jgi:VCBS repeat-containing protein
LTAEAVQSFANPDGIAIPAQGPATLYPSTIQVSGFQTPIANVAVTLHRFSHTAPEDVDVLLVGPDGQSAIIMSDVGGLNPATLLTFTLHDQAATPLPQSTALSSGTFQPTNAPGSDPFPPPAPTPSGGSALSVFNGTNPNGTWQLFVNDNQVTNSGAFNGGWSLLITTVNGAPTAQGERFQIKAGKLLTVPAAGVLGNDSDPDGDPLTAVVASQPKKGNLSLQSDGSFTFKAKKKAKGKDSFTYLARDPGGLETVATVNIQIKAKKDKKKGKGGR